MHGTTIKGWWMEMMSELSLEVLNCLTVPMYFFPLTVYFLPLAPKVCHLFQVKFILKGLHRSPIIDHGEVGRNIEHAQSFQTKALTKPIKQWPNEDVGGVFFTMSSPSSLAHYPYVDCLTPLRAP
nr:hypothetical protein Iba_chr09aCG14170 [Ipomoea batatas]